MISLTALNEQFGLPGRLLFAPGPGNLTTAFIDSKKASAQVTLYGGHVLAYQPHDQPPVLWLSQESAFTPGKAIRGGIPVCWPWFANHPTEPDKPAHGFARINEWTVLGSEITASQATRLRLELNDNPTTQALWPHSFHLELTVTVGPALQVELLVYNPGEKSFTYTGALHSYFAVSDIAHVTITGLEDTPYLDKTAGYQRRVQAGPLAVTGETNGIYLDTTADCVIEDSGWQRQIRVAKSGSQTTVVWNPWAEQARQMADFNDEAYRQMVCVETANAAEDIITVPAGESRRLEMVISPETV